MSRNSAGAPSRANIQKLANASENAPSSRPYMLVNYDPTNKRKNEFPIKPLPIDDYDTDWKIKAELKDSDVISAARPLPITDRDISYIKRKRNDEEYAAFNAWIGTKYDLTDPAQQEMFKRIYPEYFKQRQELIDEQIDVTARYAKIRLNGAESQEDLILEWEIETGRTVLPQGPIWDPLTWIANQGADAGTQMKLFGATRDAMTPTSMLDASGAEMSRYNRGVYKAGLFSPLKPVPVDGGGLMPNFQNRSDIVGIPKSNYVGPFAADQPSNTNYGTQYGGPNIYDNRYIGAKAPVGAQDKYFENRRRAATASNYRRRSDALPANDFLPAPAGFF